MIIQVVFLKELGYSMFSNDAIIGLVFAGFIVVFGSIIFLFIRKKAGTQRSVLKELSTENKRLKKELSELHERVVMQGREIKIREREESEHRWFNSGLALFSELLSRHKDNLDVLNRELITKIVTYMEGVQGALFLLHEEDGVKYLMLDAGYGIPKERIENCRFLPGEGEVGACFIDAKIKHYAKVPKDYTKVSSGLGDDEPASLLIVPLKFEDLVLGVLELSFFKKLKHYEIEFIEKLSINITSIISSVLNNQKVSIMLEESNKLGAEMAEHEKELEEKLAELNALQEESSQREDDLIQIAENYETEKEEFLQEIESLKKQIEEK